MIIGFPKRTCTKITEQSGRTNVEHAINVGGVFHALRYLERCACCLLAGYAAPSDAAQSGKGYSHQGRRAMSGIASVYGQSSGSRTASGEHLQEGALTAAHPSRIDGIRLYREQS